MTKKEFIGKLQMVYVGDRNAFSELVSVYSDLQQRNDKAIEYLNEIKDSPFTDWNEFKNKLLSILQGEEVK